MRGQIIKRGPSTYLVRIPRGKDATGKRIYHNHTVHGTKRTAHEYQAKILREMDLGVFVERSNEGVGAFLKRWLEDVAAKVVRPRTLQDYSAIVKRHATPRLGNYTLGQLTTELIEKAYTDMSVSGLSPRTINLVHSVLHNALSHAVARGHLAKNPSDGATRPRSKHREMRALTPEEANTFLGAASGTRLEALWVLLLTSGLRPGEALALKWGDLEGDEIRVKRSLVFLADGTPQEEDPKTPKARRTVLLPKSTIEALKRHKVKQNEARLKAGDEWVSNDYIFCSQTGRALEWRVVSRRYFKPLLKKAGLSGVRPYDLRHSCATLLLSKGENIKVVSERLGHATVALTLDVYSHVLPGMQQEAADKLENLLFKQA